MQDVSYLNRLKDQISEGKKKSDPPLKENTLRVIHARVVPPPTRKSNWDERAAAILHNPAWETAGGQRPSLVFVAAEHAHFYFENPPKTTTMAVVISISTTVWSRAVLKPGDRGLCLCTGTFLSNLAEVFAYFVLEEDAFSRAQAEKIVGEPLGHLTDSEVEDALTKKGRASWTPAPALYYRVPSMPRSKKFREWSTVPGKNLIRLEKKMSFNKFNEHMHLLFGKC